MNDPIFICSWSEPLLDRLAGKPLVIVTRSMEELERASATATDRRVNVHRIILRCKGSLSSLPLKKGSTPYPLAIFAARPGRFQDLVRLLPVLRELNVRVFLPADEAGSITGIRILASLGIEAAVTLDDGPVLWEPLTDLMTYALLGLVPHAGIEPFRYIATYYDQSSRNDWGAVYFDDPQTYLHVDESGRIALSPADLKEGRLVASCVEDLTEEARAMACEERRDAWRDHFLRRAPCAACQGWRVCVGRMATHAGKGGCTGLFTELMDVVDRHLEAREKVKSTWQP